MKQQSASAIMSHTALLTHKVESLQQKLVSDHGNSLLHREIHQMQEVLPAQKPSRLTDDVLKLQKELEESQKTTASKETTIRMLKNKLRVIEKGRMSQQEKQVGMQHH